MNYLVIFGIVFAIVIVLTIGYEVFATKATKAGDFTDWKASVFDPMFAPLPVNGGQIKLSNVQPLLTKQPEDYNFQIYTQTLRAGENPSVIFRISNKDGSKWWYNSIPLTFHN